MLSNRTDMKRTTLFTALLIIATATVTLAQRSLNVAMAGIEVKPMVVSIADVEVAETGNWKTIGLNDLIQATHIPVDAKIQGIEISFSRNFQSENVVYDDIVKLIVPSTEEGEDCVSANKAQSTPWSSDQDKVTLGGINDNWGLGQVCLQQIKEKGLYLEYKADGISSFDMSNLNVTIHFETASKTVKAASFR